MDDSNALEYYKHAYANTRVVRLQRASRQIKLNYEYSLRGEII